MKTEQAYTKDRALKFALSSLSHCDSSKKALYDKLIARGCDREIASDTVDYVVGLGYINEERQIERLALDLHTRRLYGKRKIFLHIVKKGYSPKDVSKIITALMERDEIDFARSRAELLKKYPSELSFDEKRKILLKNGYTDV